MQVCHRALLAALRGGRQQRFQQRRRLVRRPCARAARVPGWSAQRPAPSARRSSRAGGCRRAARLGLGQPPRRQCNTPVSTSTLASRPGPAPRGPAPTPRPAARAPRQDARFRGRWRPAPQRAQALAAMAGRRRERQRLAQRRFGTRGHGPRRRPCQVQQRRQLTLPMADAAEDRQDLLVRRQRALRSPCWLSAEPMLPIAPGPPSSSPDAREARWPHGPRRSPACSVRCAGAKAPPGCSAPAPAPSRRPGA